ncbi:MAG: sulfur carrier protein ThiS [Candidatus Wenzhouxiangella sp. M2_3B_020]
MDITVNGEPHSLDQSLSISELLERLDLGDKRVAVERNGEIVPRSTHAERVVEPGDRIEIVHAIGGG